MYGVTDMLVYTAKLSKKKGIMFVVILLIKKFVNNAAEHHAEQNANA